MDASYYRELIRPIFAGRRWILATDLLVTAAHQAQLLRELGAEACMIVAGSRGTGPVPGEDEVEHVVLNVGGDTIMEAIRASERALANVPDAVVARIDAFDPDRRARAIGTLFSAGTPIAGRPYYGTRAPAWQALEDKMTIDALWDAVGVTRAPSEIVPASLRELEAAAARLERGAGTVWVGDNREGFHGGGEYLRWVRDRDEARTAAEFLSAHCDRARVMPFLEGLPCSIHAVVFPENVIAFRPVEMMVLQVPGSNRLCYARAATFWDPPDTDRAEMRAIAARVGAHLREAVGYRGAFTIDGVMTADGFRPTELNPRVGGALSLVTAGLPELPFYFLNLAILEGEALDYRPAELERLVLETADAHRSGGGAMPVTKPVSDSAETLVVFEGGRCRVAAEGEAADATMRLGPSPLGGYLMLELSPERTVRGRSVAPLVAAGWALADELWDLGIGPVSPAPDVRPRPE